MTASIIIAKANSSRLPGKNMMDFCGHPLTAWTIVQSVNSVLIDETYLSTDSEEIAKMAESYGAQIVWRDYVEEESAPANVPMCHMIRKIQKEKQLDVIVPLLPTSPARLPDDLDNIIRLKNKLGVKAIDSQTPHNEAIEFEVTAPNTCRIALWDKTGKYVTQGGAISAYDADHYLETLEYDIDVWSWEQLQELRKKNHMAANYFYREMIYYPLKIWQSPDIDYEDEFEWVQLIMQHYILKGRGIEIYEEYREREEKRISVDGKRAS